MQNPTTTAKFNTGDMVHTITKGVNGKAKGTVKVSKTAKHIRVAEWREGWVSDDVNGKGWGWFYMIGKSGNTWRSEEDLIAAEQPKAAKPETKEDKGGEWVGIAYTVGPIKEMKIIE